METIKIANKDVEIYYANALTSGYGHKKITVELNYQDDYQKFTATTSNMPGYDKANDLEGEEKYFALYELIESEIENEVIEWLNSL